MPDQDWVTRLDETLKEPQGVPSFAQPVRRGQPGDGDTWAAALSSSPPRVGERQRGGSDGRKRKWRPLPASFARVTPPQAGEGARAARPRRGREDDFRRNRRANNKRCKEGTHESALAGAKTQWLTSTARSRQPRWRSTSRGRRPGGWAVSRSRAASSCPP